MHFYAVLWTLQQYAEWIDFQHVPLRCHSAGGDDEGAALLTSLNLVAARSGESLEVGREAKLKLIPCPTPRWPDLLVVYSPTDRLVFTSKLFSAHVRYAALCYAL